MEKTWDIEFESGHGGFKGKSFDIELCDLAGILEAIR
jgi:hypothetical protein